MSDVVQQSTRIGISDFDSNAFYSRRITGLSEERRFLLLETLRNRMHKKLSWAMVCSEPKPEAPKDKRDYNNEILQILLSKGELDIFTGKIPESSAQEPLTSCLIREVCEHTLEPLEKALGSEELVQNYFDGLKEEARK